MIDLVVTSILVAISLVLLFVFFCFLAVYILEREKDKEHIRETKETHYPVYIEEKEDGTCNWECGHCDYKFCNWKQQDLKDWIGENRYYLATIKTDHVW